MPFKANCRCSLDIALKTNSSPAVFGMKIWSVTEQMHKALALKKSSDDQHPFIVEVDTRNSVPSRILEKGEVDTRGWIRYTFEIVESLWEIDSRASSGRELGFSDLGLSGRKIGEDTTTYGHVRRTETARIATLLPKKTAIPIIRPLPSPHYRHINRYLRRLSSFRLPYW